MPGYGFSAQETKHCFTTSRKFCETDRANRCAGLFVLA